MFRPEGPKDLSVSGLPRTLSIGTVMMCLYTERSASTKSQRTVAVPNSYSTVEGEVRVLKKQNASSEKQNTFMQKDLGSRVPGTVTIGTPCRGVTGSGTGTRDATHGRRRRLTPLELIYLV